MKKSLLLMSFALALVVMFSAAAYAEEEFSASGTITNYSEGKSIVFVTDDNTVTLAIDGDTIIDGDITSGAEAYVEWKDNTALYIEIYSGIIEEDEEQ